MSQTMPYSNAPNNSGGEGALIGGVLLSRPLTTSPFPARQVRPGRLGRTYYLRRRACCNGTSPATAAALLAVVLPGGPGIPSAPPSRTHTAIVPATAGHNWDAWADDASVPWLPTAEPSHSPGQALLEHRGYTTVGTASLLYLVKINHIDAGPSRTRWSLRRSWLRHCWHCWPFAHALVAAS